MGQSQSQELRLKVLVVNNGDFFTIAVSRVASCQDLIPSINQQDPNYFGRRRIEVYSAKKSDGSWLEVTEKQRQQLKLGLVPFEVFKVIHTTDSVDPWASASKYDFPPADQLGVNEFHLLVQKVGVRIVVESTWKETAVPSPVLLEGGIAAVTRTGTVIEPQKLHLSNFKQFQDTKQPRKFVIPVADNMTGMGKTMLAINYIQWCREMWSDETNRSLFQKELCSCHTIFPIAPSPELLGKRISETLVNMSLVDAINDELEPGTEIDMASALEMDFVSLTKHFVNTLGPLFIVLDDMDRWFRRV